MKRIYLTATFIGKAADHGYLPSQNYHLQISQRIFGQKLDVKPVQGFYKKQVKGLQTGVYEHLGDFLKDWKIVEMEAVHGYFGD